MLHFELDAARLTPFVPNGLQLDDFGGRNFVSLIGFQFRKTKILGVPIPFHRTFEEVNLRLYVRRKVHGELHRGVVFIKELVPRRAVAWVARGIYGEPYEHRPMRHSVTRQGNARAFRYEWRQGGTWEGLGATALGSAEPLTPGSELAFLSER